MCRTLPTVSISSFLTLILFPLSSLARSPIHSFSFSFLSNLFSDFCCFQQIFSVLLVRCSIYMYVYAIYLYYTVVFVEAAAMCTVSHVFFPLYSKHHVKCMCVGCVFAFILSSITVLLQIYSYWCKFHVFISAVSSLLISQFQFLFFVSLYELLVVVII